METAERWHLAPSYRQRPSGSAGQLVRRKYLLPLVRRRTGLAVGLPTETQWEYAAGGPAGLRWPFGDTYKPGMANIEHSRDDTSTPIPAKHVQAIRYGWERLRVVRGLVRRPMGKSRSCPLGCSQPGSAGSRCRKLQDLAWRIVVRYPVPLPYRQSLFRGPNFGRGKLGIPPVRGPNRRTGPNADLRARLGFACRQICLKGIDHGRQLRTSDIRNPAQSAYPRRRAQAHRR